MSIELLWIIPAVAAAVCALAIWAASQKKPGGIDEGGSTDLDREVEYFNRGDTVEEQTRSSGSQSRLGEVENTVQLVNTVLSNQQKLIENYIGKDVNLERELNGLESKLRDLQQEYDITVSENYSLRARVKNLARENDHLRGRGRDAAGPESAADDVPGEKRGTKPYDDTRTLRQAELDDTSEIDIAELT